MNFAQLQISKLLVIVLVLCSCTTSVMAGRVSKRQIRDDKKREVAGPVKAELSAAAAVTPIENGSRENDAGEPNETTAMQSAGEPSLSVWGLVSRLWNWFSADGSESFFGHGDADGDAKTSAVGEGRTFGKIRRLQMALIPIVFKFGVLSAMVAFLVGLGIKTLFLVKVLVVMNLLALLAKFFTLKSHFGHEEIIAGPSAPMWKWSPYTSAGWHSIPEEHHNKKEIHLHIHGGQLTPHASGYAIGNGGASQSPGWERRNDPYSGYEATALQAQPGELVPRELTTIVNSVGRNGQHLSSDFQGNHQKF